MRASNRTCLASQQKAKKLESIVMKKLKFKNFVALSLTLVMALVLLFTPAVAEAQESRTLTSYFDDFFQEKALEDWLAQIKKPFGQEVDFGMEVSPGMLMDAQTAMALNKLGFKINYQADLLGTGAVSHNFGIYNKEDTSKTLNFAFKVVNDNLLVDVPGILDKPVFMSEKDFGDMASLASPAAAEGSGMMALPEVLAQHGEQAKADFLAAKDNYLGKFEDLGEQTANFTVGEVSEELTVISKTIAAENLREASLEFVKEIRASEAITAITDLIPFKGDSISDLDLDSLSVGGGDMDEDNSEEDWDFEDDEYEDYYDNYDFNFDGDSITVTQALDNLIADLENGDLDPMAITWDEYMSADGIKRGNKLTLQKPDTDERICLEGFNVKSADQAMTGVYFAMSASPSIVEDNEIEPEKLVDGLLPLATYQLVDREDTAAGTSAGDFSINIYEAGDLLQGSYKDVSIVKQGDAPEILLGQIDINLTTVSEQPSYEDVETEDSDEENPDTYGSIKWVEKETNTALSLNAYLEGEAYKLDCKLVPDTLLEDQFITLHMSPRFLAENELDLTTELPADYYDLNNEEDMQALQGNADIATKLVQALSALGLDEGAAYQGE